MVEYNTSNPRIILRDWAKGNILNLLSQYKNRDKLNFVFEQDSFFDAAIFDELLSSLNQLNRNIEDCSFFIEVPQKSNFTQQEWQNIEKFNKQLKQHGSKLEFKEMTMVWSFEEVENANRKVKQTIDEIASKDLSPLEQFLKAFKTVANNKYTAEGENESFLISRSLYGVLNSDKIVCVGYANWLSEIINGLNNPNLGCEKLSLKVNSDTSSDRHAANIVYIKDEKYDIDGLYYVDACFSSQITKDSDHDLTYCLIPIDDLKQLNHKKIIPYGESPFFCFLSNEEPNLSLLSYFYQNSSQLFTSIPGLEYNELRNQFAKSLTDRSSQAIININNKTEEIKHIVYEALGYQKIISLQNSIELVNILDKRADGKLSEAEFNRLLKEVFENILKDNPDNGLQLLDIIEPWKQKWLQTRQKSYETLINCLNIKNGVFASSKIELRFQQYYATTIKDRSKPVTAETFAKAYLNVLMAEGKEETAARKQIDEILHKTINQTYYAFKVPSCKGDFASKSKERFDARAKRIQEMRNRIQKRKERKKNNQTETSNEDISK